MNDDRNRALIEALLFASARPLALDTIQEVSGLERTVIRRVMEQLEGEYRSEARGFSLEEVAEGYQLRSKVDFAEVIARLHQIRSRRRFTRSALETLSIIAYRQPAARSEIEHIRGVDSGAVIKGLLSQGMIRILGRKEGPGRPILYGTTREFLEYFGLRDLESLPTLEEVTELLEEEQERMGGDTGSVSEDEERTSDPETGEPDDSDH